MIGSSDQARQAKNGLLNAALELFPVLHCSVHAIVVRQGGSDHQNMEDLVTVQLW